MGRLFINMVFRRRVDRAEKEMKHKRRGDGMSIREKKTRFLRPDARKVAVFRAKTAFRLSA
jgi:hypothetical protein